MLSDFLISTPILSGGEGGAMGGIGNEFGGGGMDPELEMVFPYFSNIFQHIRLSEFPLKKKKKEI